MAKIKCPHCGQAVRVSSADDVAREIGVSRRRVSAIAKSRKLGTRLHGRQLLFSDVDIGAMRDREPGPRKTK